MDLVARSLGRPGVRLAFLFSFPLLLTHRPLAETRAQRYVIGFVRDTVSLA